MSHDNILSHHDRVSPTCVGYGHNAGVAAGKKASREDLSKTHTRLSREDGRGQRLEGREEV
jgi:hypothetical protein